MVQIKFQSRTSATFRSSGAEAPGIVESSIEWSGSTFAIDAGSDHLMEGWSHANPVQRRQAGRQGFQGNPSRRLRAFVIDFGENQARVGFVQDDQSIIEYLLPEKQLRKAGITAVNQPFEMDEIEQRVDEGYLTGYVFRPMAPAAAVITDSLDADDELAELRDAALRHFGEEADD